jgi:hypothetical protein
MWKRIQTIYLAISAGLITSMFFCRFATIIGPEGAEEVIRYYEKTPYLILLIMLITASIFTIATYRTRFLQARVCMLTALILAGFQIWLGIDFLMYRNEMVFSVTMLFPMAAAILDMMASKRIMTDEFILMTHKKIKRKR